MNAISQTSASRLTLIADLPSGPKAEFMPDQVTIENGPKSSVVVGRAAWAEIVARSATFDAILSGEAVPPISLLQTPVRNFYPEIGAKIGGGFCVGRHPTAEGAILVVAGIDGEKDDINWPSAAEHCQNYRGGDLADWRCPTRIEALLIWDRLSQSKTGVSSFKKGGKHAFAESTYWTGQEYEFDSACAWGQFFGSGHSSGWGKAGALRGRPGRILFI